MLGRTGKAREDVLLYIDGDNGIVQILSAPDEEVNSHIISEELHKEFAGSEEHLQHVSVVSSGRASSHVNITCLNFSFWDKRRKVARLKQAGRGGTGSVFRDKKLKALVVKYSALSGDTNDPEDIDTLQKTGLKLHNEIEKGDSSQCHMREMGTAHLMEIMNDYDLLPIRNFKYGQMPEAISLASWSSKSSSPNRQMLMYGCSLLLQRG
jgi:aldehyde:ferredoxin oxidoreductase